MTSEKEVRKTLKKIFKRLNGVRVVAYSSDETRATTEYSCNLSYAEYKNLEKICMESEKEDLN